MCDLWEFRHLHVLISDSTHCTYGSLTVYTSVSGLELYTNRGYLKSLNRFLRDVMNLPEVTFSEQGMQGANYTNHDIDYEFMLKWLVRGYDSLIYK